LHRPVKPRTVFQEMLFRRIKPRPETRCCKVYSILISLDRMKRPVPAGLIEKMHELMDG
jgi:hypothetical protein